MRSPRFACDDGLPQPLRGLATTDRHPAKLHYAAFGGTKGAGQAAATLHYPATLRYAGQAPGKLLLAAGELLGEVVLAVGQGLEQIYPVYTHYAGFNYS